MTNRRILALATTAFLVLGGVAFAASGSSGTNSISPSSTPASASSPAASATPAKTAPATPKLPKSLVGIAKSFHTADNKALVVEDKAGAWYKIDLSTTCAPLAKADSIRIAKSRTAGKIGSVVVGKTYCTIASFAQTPAPAASSSAPAATTTTTH